MNEQQNVRIVQQGYEAFGRGDIPTLLTMFSEDIEWRIPEIEGAPYSRDYRGRDGVARFFSELERNEEILRFEPREYIGQGDRVVVIGDYAATVKSTGRKFEMPWVHIYTVRDGKIASFHEFGDTAAAARAFRRTSVPVPA